MLMLMRMLGRFNEWNEVMSSVRLSRGRIVVFFLMRHLMPSLGSSAQKMIFLLYGPNFLLFPKEEKEKSCNNLKSGERSWVRGLVIRREGISTQRIYSTL